MLIELHHMVLAIASLALLSGSQSLAESVDARFRSAEAEGFSGSVLVVKGGKPILSKGYGVDGSLAKSRNTPSTIFSIGSVTKWFTALVALRLEQDKKLSLNDGIGKYISGVPQDKAKITVKDLIAHGAGFGEYIDRPGEGGDFAKISKAEAQRRILSSKLLFAPGTRSEYSNVGYTLLAMVIEKASGMKYEECVRRFIFAPAKMTRSGFFGDQKWPAKDFAVGMNAKTHGKVNSAYYWGKPTWSLVGAGGIVSTCEDLGKAILALTQGKIVSMANEPRMFQPLFEREGFGWMVGRSTAGTPFCNVGGGDNFGFQAAILYLPTEGNLVISCSNSDTPAKMSSANIDVLRLLK